MKLLTIVVPAYNMQDYLANNIESVLKAERRNDIEVLVVDDGSTDATKAVAEAYVEKHPLIVRCLSKENGHYGSAVNCGIDNARGLFLKIIDSDDWVDPKGLDQLVDVIAKHPELDLIISDYEKVLQSEREVVKGVENPPSEGVFSFDDVVLSPLVMHALSVRTSILKENNIRLDEGILFTDEEFALFFVPFVQKSFYTPHVVYEYRLDREGQSVDMRALDKTMEDNNFIMRRSLEWYSSLDKSTMSENRLSYLESKIAWMIVFHLRRRYVSEDNKANKIAAKFYGRVLLRDLPRSEAGIPRSIEMLSKTNYLGYGIVAFLFRRKARAQKHL